MRNSWSVWPPRKDARKRPSGLSARRHCAISPGMLFTQWSPKLVMITSTLAFWSGRCSSSASAHVSSGTCTPRVARSAAHSCASRIVAADESNIWRCLTPALPSASCSSTCRPAPPKVTATGNSLPLMSSNRSSRRIVTSAASGSLPATRLAVAARSRCATFTARSNTDLGASRSEKQRTGVVATPATLLPTSREIGRTAAAEPTKRYIVSAG
mmetsp:Transcript_45106/g.116852  ORF Transcript_45106/g.116852 Transcript_45106/m.116852 type:complete len:213 (-) Transcript_45106:252-890(-)